MTVRPGDEPVDVSSNAGQEGEEGEEVDGKISKGVPVGPAPTSQEIEEHMRTHVPCRAWCPHCVRGKAQGKAHRRREPVKGEVPTVSIDFMFMEDNAEEQEGTPILVIKEDRYGLRGAHPLPGKAVTQY